MNSVGLLYKGIATDIDGIEFENNSVDVTKGSGLGALKLITDA